MKTKVLLSFTGIIIFIAGCFTTVSSQAGPDKITTNKEKLVTMAVQGQIAPAEPSRSYVTTWNGEAKMAIGIGGINYNLKIGDRIFGWANGDRATMGVATIGAGEDRQRSAWLNYTSVGNKVKVLTGEAKGETGIITAKFGSYVLVHFEEDVLNKLAIDDKIQAKAQGIGLEIEGFSELFAHGISPEVLEEIVTLKNDKMLEVPVMKVIPAEIVGQGAGGSSLNGNWHIQTCYPPDIKEYGLDELRYGDLVLLKDIQTDYGKGYYRGGATLGIVCSGPSDVAGLGIGVTPVLSTRSDKISPRIDPTANIAKFLGIEVSETTNSSNSSSIKTNRDDLIATAVQAVIHPAGGRSYSTTWDGSPKLSIGSGSINYSVSIGDPVYGWANADHVEPDITIQGRDKDRPSDCAVAILACIGNEAKVISGDATGAKGIYIGRHAYSDDLVWFPEDVVESLAVDDEIQIRASGVGLKIDGFEDVRVNKLSPELLENLGIQIKGDQLLVPVAMEIPGHIMGAGIAGSFLENVDYDIQTTCPEIVEEYKLKELKLGDLVAIRNHYDYFGRGRYEGAVTIGVCIHGWSDSAGHGPGLDPILSALPGKIETRIDKGANIAYYLGIKKEN